MKSGPKRTHSDPLHRAKNSGAAAAFRGYQCRTLEVLQEKNGYTLKEAKAYIDAFRKTKKSMKEQGKRRAEDEARVVVQTGRLERNEEAINSFAKSREFTDEQKAAFTEIFYAIAPSNEALAARHANKLGYDFARRAVRKFKNDSTAVLPSEMTVMTRAFKKYPESFSLRDDFIAGYNKYMTFYKGKSKAEESNLPRKREREESIAIGEVFEPAPKMAKISKDLTDSDSDCSSTDFENMPMLSDSRNTYLPDFSSLRSSLTPEEVLGAPLNLTPMDWEPTCDLGPNIRMST